MTDHEFGISVMQWLLIVMAILGTAIALEHLFERRPRRRREYRMRYDRHDDQRRVERNGFKSRISAK